MRRAEVYEMLEDMGASVSNTVTSNTDLLIVGTNRGERKYNDAMHKGVAIVPWEMLVASGLLHRGSKREEIDYPNEFLGELALQMFIVLDNIYAHSVTERDPRWFRAYKLGAAALDLFLQAAWEAREGGDPHGRDGFIKTTDEDPRRLMKLATAGWAGMVKTLKGEEECASTPEPKEPAQ